MGILEDEKLPPPKFNFFYWHGIMLALSWTLFALVQIGSVRYLKGTYWRVNIWIHAISGAGITIITIVFSIWGLYDIISGPGFLSHVNHPHAWAGCIVLSLATLISIGGSISWYMMKYSVWNT